MYKGFSKRVKEVEHRPFHNLEPTHVTGLFKIQKLDKAINEDHQLEL
jgi:hypothetical protein